MSIFNKFEIKSNIRDYSVRFVDDSSEALKEDTSKGSFFIIDQNVFNLYPGTFRDVVEAGRFLTVEATELHKTLDYVEGVIKSLLDRNIKKNHKLIAIGGGIVQDIAGFLASILFRGIDWVFYPTTLLAQSDSCIGSKTSINIGHFKNQCGTFYPPHHIVIDTHFLKTLNLTDMKSGMGEIIKVHFLAGPKSFGYISSHGQQAFSDPGLLKSLIFKSLMIKKNIIEKDEFDKGYRNILNYGHTFGHAIESITDYKISHGQAVTLGMDIANYVSLKMGLLSERSYDMMHATLLKNYPEWSLKSGEKDSFLSALSKDKKNTGEELTAILTKGPGRMRKTQISLDDNFRKIIDSYILKN